MKQTRQLFCYVDSVLSYNVTDITMSECYVSSTISHTIFGQTSIWQYIDNTWFEFKTVKRDTSECECHYFSSFFIILIEEPL